MRYKRLFAPGGTYFFTVVTFNRNRIFTTESIVAFLRNAFAIVKKKHPFTIDAIVILPDHIHTIWTMPENDLDYPLRWRLIKTQFTQSLQGKLEVISISRKLKNEQAVWQRRYWEHEIRNQEDFNHHMDYIHYNPVKHQLCQSPFEWRYSSFHQCVEDGLYSQDWGTDPIELAEDVGFE